MNELIPRQEQDNHPEIALQGFMSWYMRVSAHYHEALDAQPKDINGAFEARATLDAMEDAEPELRQQMLAAKHAELWSNNDRSFEHVS